MAFTDYKTWASGETLTSANFNAQIRDNGLAMGPHLIVRKPSDESVSSNTTVQNDDDLLMSVAANSTYLVRLHILFTAVASTGDLKLGFTHPASANVFLRGLAHQTGGNFADFLWNGSSPTSALTILGLSSGGSTDYRAIVIEGLVITAGTAGTFQLQWAQGSSTGTATTVKANSTLWAVKLA